MKKQALLALLIVLISLPMIKAQTGSGTMLLGASSAVNLTGSGPNLMSIGFTSTKNKSNASGYVESDPDKTTDLNLIPKFGIFVIDNLAVGLDVIIQYSQSKTGGSDNKYSNTLLAAGPFVRYYLPTGNFLPFVEGNATFGSSKWKDNYGSESDEGKYSIMSFGGGLGVAALLGKRVSLDVMAGYNTANIKAKEDNPDDERTIIGAFGIRLGLVIYLGVK